MQEGATLEHFLLEKVRVIERAQGERNFHVFYQVCCVVCTKP